MNVEWGKNEAALYEVAKHGPDGKIFLDPPLYESLTTKAVKGKDAIDIGGGTGPWTEYLAKQGARRVVSLDLNDQMLRTGQATRFERTGSIAHHLKGGKGKIALEQASAAALPHPDNAFHVETSINVGCNLPEGVFQDHFREAYRVARNEGVLIVTAPNSLTTVFTDGANPETIQPYIDEKWAANSDHSKDRAKAILQELTHVLRGTFVLDSEGKPVLINEQTADLVQNGTPILRKIPGLVVDNMYHTAEEYRSSAHAAGWVIEKDAEQSFASEEERIRYNANLPANEQLGPEYVGNAPFLMLQLRKFKTFNNFFDNLPGGRYRTMTVKNPKHNKLIEDLDRTAERLGIDTSSIYIEMDRGNSKVWEAIEMIQAGGEKSKESITIAEEGDRIRREAHQKMAPLFEEMLKLGYTWEELWA